MARAASRKTRTKTSASVLLHVNTNRVNSFKVPKKRSQYRHKQPKLDRKTKWKETRKNEAAYQILRTFTTFGVRGNEKKRGCLPNTEDIYNVWSSGKREKTDID